MGRLKKNSRTGSISSGTVTASGISTSSISTTPKKYTFPDPLSFVQTSHSNPKAVQEECDADHIQHYNLDHESWDIIDTTNIKRENISQDQFGKEGHHDQEKFIGATTTSPIPSPNSNSSPNHSQGSSSNIYHSNSRQDCVSSNPKSNDIKYETNYKKINNNNNNTIASTVTTSTDQNRNRKRKCETTSTPPTNLEDRITTFMDRFETKSDPDMDFFTSILPSIKTLTLDQKLIFRVEVIRALQKVKAGDSGSAS